MWLAEPWQTPTLNGSLSTVFDRVEIELTWIKLGAQKNAQFFTRLAKNRLGKAQVKPNDLRSFEIRFELAVQFDSKGIGRFENFRIESAVPAPLLVVSLVERPNH